MATTKTKSKNKKSAAKGSTNLVKKFKLTPMKGFFALLALLVLITTFYAGLSYWKKHTLTANAERWQTLYRSGNAKVSACRIPSGSYSIIKTVTVRNNSFTQGVWISAWSGATRIQSVTSNGWWGGYANGMDLRIANSLQYRVSLLQGGRYVTVVGNRAVTSIQRC